MAFIFFIISFVASVIGAISGIGGGIIIKPALDATQFLSVMTVSFLSGCTVLSMSTVSLLRRNDEIKTKVGKPGFFLAIGAALGGIIGGEILSYIKKTLQKDSLVGLTQSSIILFTVILIFLYFFFKNNIPHAHIKSPLISAFIGLALGIISAFLGIGGGPLNIAVLYLLFSMDAKTATINSISIIFASQLTNLISLILLGKVPNFDVFILVLMIIAGIAGGLSGTWINKKMKEKHVQTFFVCILFLIILISGYNIMRFSGMF